ncbi:MAG: ABC transporter permease [Candidatus Woesearchaeota archaeon]
MKFFNIISKNFKVLFRQKTSLLSIILGPLLIIFLIGIAFNSSSSIEITVGYHAPDNSTLTDEFLDTLKQNDYVLKPYTHNDTCIDDLKHGLVHTCIFFPDDFKIQKGQTGNIEFYVDQSRMNIVYTVIDRVSERIDLKTDQLSMNLTQRLTDTMDSSAARVDSSIGKIIKIKKQVLDSKSDVSGIKGELDNLDLDAEDVSFDLSQDLTEAESTQQDMYDSVKSAVLEGYALIESIRNQTSDSNITSDLNNLENELEGLNESTLTLNQTGSQQFSTLAKKVSDTSSKVNSLKSKLADVQDVRQSTIEKLDSFDDQLTTMVKDLNSTKQDLEQASKALGAVDITSSDQIVNPVTTSIKTVSSSNRIAMLFPYVLMLIIMFVGLLLSSTLVVVEKKSRAAFRVFTTPTRDEYFIITTFLTSFIIIIFQTLIILAAAKIFSVDLLTQNLLVNSILLILGTSIFIMLGMCLGYLLPNQQSSNMASISLGAIFLFLSNLVLPVESISPYLQKVAQYNPYVLSSETLRQSILFSLGFDKLGNSIMLLLGYTIIIFLLIIVVQRVSKMRFLKNSSHLKHDKTFHPNSLWMKNERIDDERELITALKNLDDKEYKKFVRKHPKEFKRFIATELEQPDIAKKVRKLSRKKLLEALIKKNEEIISDIKRVKLRNK